MKNWLVVIALVGVGSGLALWFSRNSSSISPHRTVESGLQTARPTTTGDSVHPLTSSTPATANAGSIPSPPAVSGLVQVLAGIPTASSTSVVVLATRLPASPQSPEPLPTITPAIALDNLRVTVRRYGSMFGGNPVGTNAEITKALHGGNPKGVNFLGQSLSRINENGELVDPWGTPYFFHQLSATDMEIRSAGPDKRMWTGDDIVTH